MDTQPITYRLPAELYERLRALAFKLRKPMNHIVVEAIDKHVTELESTPAGGEPDRQD